ncbi:glycoside hydrolase family 43 protein [Paenarthrobacter sp. YIM B13468]|uniref:glycoside hydrolase family 43 protein n=1 Tax=Paenarthrobacter sp. YIM B13468 TaxID=3366295 RepID=UPI00366D49C8
MTATSTLTGADGKQMTNSATQPILSGFYPDPTICRVGDDYYLSTSSFEYFPGAPIFHSTDLVNWTQQGHILDRRSQFRLGDPRPSTGIYGSTLREHDGIFWFITTNVSDYGAGQVLVQATDPAGPWSDPVFIGEAIGIDPDLCWDENGDCYLSWKAMSFTEGEIGILQARLDASTGKLRDAPYPIWQGSGMGAVEAPHLYRNGSYWYLLLAEGGTERGHCVTAARSLHPSGPFEACPNNPIFTHRSSIDPVQNVGHADLVQTPEGAWAAVYLGVRPRGSTPGFHVLGRETFVAGIDWMGGWPVFDEDRFCVPAVDTAFSDDFSDARLHQRWVVPSGEPESIVSKAPDGGIGLSRLADGSMGLLCARVRDLRWSAETVISGSGSFLLRIDDRNCYGLTVEAGRVSGWVHLGGIHHELGSTEAGAETTLRIESAPPLSPPVPLGHGGPDEIVLSVVQEGREHLLGRFDGRYLSTEVASGFTGRMLAIQGSQGQGTFLSMRYTPYTPQT